MLEPIASLEGWCATAVLVFEGHFTVEEDKLALVDTVLGLWSKALSTSQHGATGRLAEMVSSRMDRVFPPAYFGNLPTVLERLLREEKGGKAAAGLPAELQSRRSFWQEAQDDGALISEEEVAHNRFRMPLSSTLPPPKGSVRI